MHKITTAMLDYDRTISPNDHMAFSGQEAYFRVTDSGVECILRGVESGGIKPDDVRAVLDFGCGYGRIYRALPRIFPTATWTALELIASAARYCAETFGGEHVVSHEDLDKVIMRRKYDVVWVGSVFTHLPMHRWTGLLGFLAKNTNPGGVAIFTAHGECSLKFFETHVLKTTAHVMNPAVFSAITEALPRTGFAFAPKEPMDFDHGSKIGMNVTRGEYGFAFNTEAWLRDFIATQPHWELVSYRPAAWAGNHDVVTLLRA